MTEEQIQMLRKLILCEINRAQIDGKEHGAWGWLESELDIKWKEFQKSFNETEYDC